MMTFHFDCIFYYASDIGRSMHFYRDVLGLKFLSRDVVARFDIDGVLFEIVPAPHEQKLPRNGNARLCLRVDNVEAALQDLKAQGVSTNGPQDKSTGILASFEDPDGNEICLWQSKN
jgi:catechol 2,3-dioxygenase-like lactoylglutathione lyase family enzyme